MEDPLLAENDMVPAAAERGRWCRMKSKDDESDGIAKLRRRAEEFTGGQGLPSPEDLDKPPSPEEALKLIHELRVHQVELRMQNAELLRVQAELDATRARYFDLYNLAPVGYFVVSHEGLILEANLTGVNLLSIARAALVKRPINRFIFKEDQDVYYLHRRELLATGKASTCELRMVKPDGTTFWARLMATTTQDPSTSSGHGTGGAPVIRVVLTDISEQKQMEQQVKAAQDVKPRRAKKSPRVAPKPGRGKGGIKA